MDKKVTNTCYACDQPATTREHAPPRSFFPQNLWDNLVTVPSCSAHNNDQSKDVEYARNVISIMWGTNRVGELHFGDKSVRSLERRPSFLWKTFSDIRPVNIQDRTVGVFTVDTERIGVVMKACVCALHFHETGERIRDWEVVLPNLHLPGNATDEASTAWLQSLSLFRQLRYQGKITASPEVFEYAIAEIEGGIVYAMRFYKNFLVYTFAATKSELHPSA